MDENVTKIGGGGRLYEDARAEPAERYERPQGNLGEVLNAQKRFKEKEPEPEPQTPEATRGKAGQNAREKTKKPATTNWRDMPSSLLELTGIASITAGCWALAPWLGLIVLGVCLVLLGVAMGLPGKGAK